MKWMVFTLSLTFLYGCQSTQPAKPKGKWVWYNGEIQQKERSGELTKEQADHLFTVTMNKCKVEGLKIQVPSPSCVQPPRQDCSGMTGFSKGLCQGFTPPKKCDYSSVNSAKKAQNEIYNSCMALSGWVSRWQKHETIVESSTSNDEQDIASIVKSIPELSSWYENDTKEWKLALAIDNKLADDPKYDHISTKERLLLVVERVKTTNNSDVTATQANYVTKSEVSNTCLELLGASVIADDGKFLGAISNEFDSESIFNKFGTYGSEFETDTIWNEFGTYGDKHSDMSPFNAYTSTPPALVKNGVRIAYLTINKHLNAQVNPHYLKTCNY